LAAVLLVLRQGRFATVLTMPLKRLSVLPWPLPAVLAWGLAWGLHALSLSLGLALPGAVLIACSAGAALALLAHGTVRRACVAAGYPISLFALQGSVPAWAWGLVLLPLLLAYPLRAWRDAPFFPTPADAFAGLRERLPQPKQVLDAGCGAGHGLLALRRLWPQAQLHGLEWSPLLSLWARWRCRRAATTVQRGDMWAQPWTGFDLVYLFQRPESMARAWAKACADMPSGSHLLSLEFAVPGVKPQAELRCPDGRPLWLYRVASHATSCSMRGRRSR
jgi:SAM-dependent methyltransferase